MNLKDIALKVVETYNGAPKLFQYFIVFCLVVAIASAVAGLF